MCATREVSHLTTGFASRSEWSVGSHRVDPAEVVHFAPTAREGLELLWGAVQQFADGIAATSESDLDRVGYSAMPYGLDPIVCSARSCGGRPGSSSITPPRPR
jgi:hypothetical protein